MSWLGLSRVFAWLACTACSTQPAAHDQGTPATQAAVAHAAAIAPASAATPCPATFGVTDSCIPGEPRRVARRSGMELGGSLTVELVDELVSPVCTYAAGTCECTVPGCSGGAAVPTPPPGPEANPNHWLCTPTPPAVRSDGCPGEMPPEGGPCAVARLCSYGRCAERYVRCMQGTWTVPIQAPPKP